MILTYVSLNVNDDISVNHTNSRRAIMALSYLYQREDVAKWIENPTT